MHERLINERLINELLINELGMNYDLYITHTMPKHMA